MENMIMQFCRETHRYTRARVAVWLRVTLKEYRELETGQQLLTPKQAAQLGKLYKVKGIYFYRAALQLELLVTRREIIRVQKEEIARLRK
ncbi:MAG: hypothetical protein ABIN74_15430 [Ferruginibacter sp.]